MRLGLGEDDWIVQMTLVPHHYRNHNTRQIPTQYISSKTIMCLHSPIFLTRPTCNLKDILYIYIYIYMEVESYVLSNLDIRKGC